ncbi:MAG: hypothetical protein LC798_12765 [Chloroflexi bacterium]|nr:hypothetical protein [Chloroflexota bacterium]
MEAESFYATTRNGRAGHRSWCKPCWSTYTQEYKPGERVGFLPVGPFVAWLDELLAAVEDERGYESQLMGTLERLGLSDRSLCAYRNGERKKVSLDVVDRALTAEGEPHMLYELYPELAID